MVFGVLSLLIVVAVIGILAKKQFGSLTGAFPATGAPAVVSSPVATPQQQSLQLQNHVTKSVVDAMQQVRPEVDEK
ncbi:MAG: hypothetical protein ABI606_21115 [Rhodoferax sp.]